MGDWKSYKMPFGKYRDSGDTLYMIYINDYRYIRWLDSLKLDDKTRGAVNSAIEHKNKTDPFSN